MEKGKLSLEEQCFQHLAEYGFQPDEVESSVCANCKKLFSKEDSEYEYFCDDCEI